MDGTNFLHRSAIFFLKFNKEENQQFSLQNTKISEKVLFNVFIRLKSRRALFNANLVSRRWRIIGSDKKLWEANPERPGLPEELWELIFTYLKIKDLAACTALSKRARRLTDYAWNIKAKEYGYTSEVENAEKAKEYLKKLFCVIISLNQKEFLPPDLFSISQSVHDEFFMIETVCFESLFLKEKIKHWPVDHMIKILKSPKVSSIPNLDFFIRYYYLSADLSLPNPMPESKIEKDAPWINGVLDILQNGEDVNTPNQSDNIPLHQAVKNGQEGNIRAFLCLTKDVNYKDQKGCTALHHATNYYGKKEIINLLLEKGLDPNIPSYLGSPLHIAIRQALTFSLKSFYALLPYCNIEAVDQSGFTPLHLAAHYGNTDLVEALLARKANSMRYTSQGRLPLHEALILKNKNNKKIAQRLLKLNPESIHDSDSDGCTPLHLASKSGLLDCVELLLHYKADTNCRNIEGRLPLHEAVANNNYNNNNNYKIAELLLKQNNAIVNEPDQHLMSPLHLAADSDLFNCIKLLTSKGADPNQCNENGLLPLHIALNKNHIEVAHYLLPLSDFNKRTHEGWTSLHFAAQKGQLKVTDWLLSHGADVNLLTKEEQLPLNLAIKAGYPKMAMKIFSQSNVNKSDNAGWEFSKLLIDELKKLEKENQDLKGTSNWGAVS